MGKIIFLFSLFFVPFVNSAIAQIAGEIVNTHVVKGKIIDSNGKPVPFATLSIKNKVTGFIADSLGQIEISLNPNTILVVESVGYQPIEYDIANKTTFQVTLILKQASLQNVSVSSKTDNTVLRQASISEQQNISNTLSDYKAGGNITSAPAIFSSLKNGAEGKPSIVSAFGYNAGSGKIYSGGAIPVFSFKDQTKGRQFLFDNWVAGSVTDDKGMKVVNEKYLFNYNKIDKVLLFTEDQKSALELDMKSINSFTLTYNGEQWLYQKINLSGKTEFVRVLTQPIGRYVLYRSTTTKFLKANYVSTGLTESGNNFDEFLDSDKYMIFLQKDKIFAPVELKKKSIKAVFENEKIKLDNWFSQYEGLEIKELYLIGLVDFLNK